MPDSFDMTTLFPSRRAPRSQNQSFAEFTNSWKSRKQREKKAMPERCAMWGIEYEREDRKCEGRREVFPRTLSILYNSSVASHSFWENRGFAEKGDHITIKTKTF